MGKRPGGSTSFYIENRSQKEKEAETKLYINIDYSLQNNVQ
jgi:hypothetical protein